MEMTEAMRRFLSKEVAKASSQLMYTAMSALQTDRKEETVKGFMRQLKPYICREDICFLQIALVRHKAVMGKGFYQILGFGPEFYLAPPKVETELELDWLYQPYSEFCRSVMEDGRRYVMQIPDLDKKQICLLELDETKQVVRYLLNAAVPVFLHDEEYRSIVSWTGLQIQLSDYMGKFESIVTFDSQTKEIGEWMDGVFQNRSAV